MPPPQEVQAEEQQRRHEHVRQHQAVRPALLAKEGVHPRPGQLRVGLHGLGHGLGALAAESLHGEEPAARAVGRG